VNDTPLPDQKLTLCAAVLAGSLCVLWGANTVAIKFSLSGLGPFSAAAIRFGLSAGFLWAWAQVSSQRLSPAPGQMRLLILNSLLFFMQLSLVYVGFTMTSASRGALLTNLQPFFLLVLAHFCLSNDRITVLKLVGLILGFAGAACVLLDRHESGADLMAGDLLLLVSTILWACSAAFTKHLARSIPSVQIVFYQFLFSVPLFGLGAPLWDAPMIRRVDFGIAAAIAFQVVLTTSFAFVAWTRLMQTYGAVALHSFVFLIPVSGVFLAAVVLEEPMTEMILVAMVLITAGIAIVQFGQRRDIKTVLHGSERER
jgi:drug/metabolite transporter (DMT)-like permease